MTDTAIRVLGIADVAGSYVAAWRLGAPLEALKRLGVVSDFVITDGTLAGVPRRGSFDVLWLQRGVDQRLVTRLVDLASGGFLLDIDDHLLCRPGYLAPQEFPAPAPVAQALAGAGVVTVTSPRLGRLLSGRLQFDLSSRVHVCPNAMAFPSGPGTAPRRPDAVLLTQGHRLALTASQEPVLTAIGDFAARRGLPVCYFGPRLERISPLASRALRGVVHAGEMSLADYHRRLEALPSMLAVAPLETGGDSDTVEFVAGKSDVKMVEYGGFGHPGVYSAAAPYLESDLRCGRLAENSYEAWSEALEASWQSGWRSAPEEREDVRRRRDIAAVARGSWTAALLAARRDEPLDARDVASIADRLRARVRQVKARAAWRLWQLRSQPPA